MSQRSKKKKTFCLFSFILFRISLGAPPASKVMSGEMVVRSSPGSCEELPRTGLFGENAARVTTKWCFCTVLKYAKTWIITLNSHWSNRLIPYKMARLEKPKFIQNYSKSLTLMNLIKHQITTKMNALDFEALQKHERSHGLKHGINTNLVFYSSLQTSVLTHMAIYAFEYVEMSWMFLQELTSSYSSLSWNNSVHMKLKLLFGLGCWKLIAKCMDLTMLECLNHSINIASFYKMA